MPPTRRSPRCIYTTVVGVVAFFVVVLIFFSSSFSTSPAAAPEHESESIPTVDEPELPPPDPSRVLTAVDELFFRQSTTLDQATSRYRLRTGRLPPPGYDRWFAYARSNKCLLDDYEQLYADFEPFYQLTDRDHKYFKRMLDRATSIAKGEYLGLRSYTMRDHQFNITDKHPEDTGYGRDWMKTIQGFSSWLPNFDMVISMRDECRVQVNVHDGRSAQSMLSMQDAHPFTNRPHPTYTYYTEEGHCLFPNSDSGFLDYANNYTAFFIYSTSQEFSTDLYPILSQGRVHPCFSDILFPGSYYYDRSPSYPHVAFDDNVEWKNKEPILYWRGRVAGGMLKGENYRSFPRFRLLDLQRDNPGTMNVRLTGWNTWCDGDCDMGAIEREYGFDMNGAPREDMYKYKYVMDLDGHGWSGRFLGLLKSGSLVFKSTIFTEFHSQWIKPYEHFIPVRPDLIDLPEKLKWARENEEEARKIQQAGKEFADRVMTDAQNDCYMSLVGGSNACHLLAMDEDDAQSPQLIAVHIHRLLFNYAQLHLTTDYIALTTEAVTQLWSQYLHKVPTVDQTALRLPPDPFDTLSRIHGLGSLPPFQEKLQSTPDAIQYIKKVIGTAAKKAPSILAAELAHPSETCRPLFQPLEPILTARARRETPRPGTHAFTSSLPASHALFLDAQTIRAMPVEPISEEIVKEEDVLDTGWKVSPDEREGVRKLLLSVLVAPKEYKNRHLDPAARPDSPPPRLREYEPEFVPIFPRRRRVVGAMKQAEPPLAGLNRIAELPAAILPPVKVEELDLPLHEQHMVVIDGWQAIRSSPSPTPSPGSSQEDQVDELWSSPDTTPPPFRPAKMEVVQIPRVKKIGARRKKLDPVGHGKSLDSFLAPHIGPHPARSPPRPQRSSELGDSILGQAESHHKPDELDADLNELYGQRQDARAFIMNEKLDEQRPLLMEVPLLPPPNQHPPDGLFLPASLTDFVTPGKDSTQAFPICAHKFLKPARGIASLNVDLSWTSVVQLSTELGSAACRPFPPKTRIPTNVEVLDVVEFSQDVTPIQPILDDLSRPSQAESDVWSLRYSKHCFEGKSSLLSLEISRCEIVLSRKERRRAAGLPEHVALPESESQVVVARVAEEVRSPKRPPLQFEHQCVDDSGIAFEFLAPEYRDEDAIWPDPYVDDKPLQRENESVGYDHDDHSQFQALSFESAQETQPRLHEPPSDETYASMFEPHPGAIINDTVASQVLSAPQYAPPTTVPDISTHALGIFEFAKLRAKKVSKATVIPQPDDLPPVPPEAPKEEMSLQMTLPEDMYDQNTVTLPATWDPPTSQHRYMVSMELVQRQGLVRSLRSRTCFIDLVEREIGMGGVDLIPDPHSAVVFANMLTLPTECADLYVRTAPGQAQDSSHLLLSSRVQRVAQETWRYARVFVVFEAYPAAHSFESRSKPRRSELSAYTPPVLKAVRKFRRDLGIMEGAGKKNKGCIVQWAFADSVEDAALFVRYFGIFLEGNDETGGTIWGDRAWLEDDAPEGECDLAAADGMNLFASFIILCQIGLSEFLELSPEKRTERFARFVGMERMNLLNQVIQRRLNALDSDVDGGSRMGT
ncbi:hypothetical protein MKEN_01208400 [Mycena kentingensis (nom. inval.)]|nr:hypothetical protein MKEN_01208400 [Mycena kentingensis (nom. inval.)]